MSHDIIGYLLATLAPTAVALNLAGVALGLFVGAIPGLGGGMTMALVLPLTFAMPNVHAQTFLLGIYVGGVVGGVVSATLIGVPGAPSAIMTTLDSYAMARQGYATRALGLAIMAAFVGGLVSWLVLVACSSLLASLALDIKSFDYFLFVLMGLLLIGFTGQGSTVKALISGFIGIFASTVGYDPVSASLRYTFGVPELANGFGLLAVMLGIFAVQRIILNAGQSVETTERYGASIGGVIRALGDCFKYPVTLIRSSLIGSWIGILPGLGANIAAIVTYTSTRAISPRGKNFGTGEAEAVVASESGANASIGGALVPMIALGIPGSGQDVILMSALILHGVQPGPLLVTQHADVFYGVMGAFLLANVFVLIAMIFSINLLARVINIPMQLLAPIVLTLCVVGVISVNNRLDDAWVMLGFGFAGYLLSLAKYPIAPLIIGFVLGPLAEERLRSSLMGSSGSLWPLISDPVSIALIVVCVLVLFYPLLKAAMRKRFGNYSAA